MVLLLLRRSHYSKRSRSIAITLLMQFPSIEFESVSCSISIQLDHAGNNFL